MIGSAHMASEITTSLRCINSIIIVVVGRVRVVLVVVVVVCEYPESGLHCCCLQKVLSFFLLTEAADILRHFIKCSSLHPYLVSGSIRMRDQDCGMGHCHEITSFLDKKLISIPSKAFFRILI